MVSPEATSPGSTAPVTSWDELDAQLRTLAAKQSAIAAEIGEGRCGTGSDYKPVHAVDPTRPLAIGSSSRLYVLGDLANQIAGGKVSWQEELAVRDDWKSLFTGATRNDPAGTTHPLSFFATQMVSGDNTAADHLLHRLGRENVEGSQEQMGMADPSRNLPFLTTRELFVLKATGNAELAEQYIAADSQTRRELLNGAVATTPIAEPDLADWTSPRHIDTLERFASTTDLCYAMLKLRDLAGQPGQSGIKDMLAADPGLKVDPETWPYVGFITGAEPGVMQLTWLLQRADQRWFVFSITLNDAMRPLTDPAAPLALATEALRLLAAAP